MTTSPPSSSSPGQPGNPSRRANPGRRSIHDRRSTSDHDVTAGRVAAVRQPSPSTRRLLPRAQWLALLQAALSQGAERFARQAALAWLASYPGDLPVTRLYAQLLVQSGQARSAVPILADLCLADPEDPAAQALLQSARLAADLPPDPAVAGALYALGEPEYSRGAESSGGAVLPNWAAPLQTARLALLRGDYTAAEPAIHQALLTDSPESLALLPPLAAVTHLQLSAGLGLAPAALRRLAEAYHLRWTACLVPILLLAEAQLVGGDADQAVALLHLAAANDITGQVASRLWGPDHPYRSLWPAEPAAPLDYVPPNEVVTALGWNRLPENAADSSIVLGASNSNNSTGTTGGPTPTSQARPVASAAFQTGNLLSGNGLPVGQDVTRPVPLPTVPMAPTPVILIPPFHTAAPTPQAHGSPVQPPGTEGASRGPVPTGGPIPTVVPVPTSEPVLSPHDLPESLRSVQVELERVAARLKKNYLASADGRFPVYVILSTRRGLEHAFGPQAAVIDQALQRLAAAVSTEREWSALVFYPDDPICTAQYNLTPIRPNDPWEIKLALTDLDSALARRGEMIGALLIAGGPDVVPYHHLPNPVDDADDDVASDNPYATRDANYFVPEWPVGRLPGDAPLLLRQLESACISHLAGGQLSRPRLASRSWWRDLFARLPFFASAGKRARPSWGYTAAVWRRASLSVFRPIGDPHAMLVSPPAFAGNGASSSGIPTSSAAASIGAAAVVMPNPTASPLPSPAGLAPLAADLISTKPVAGESVPGATGNPVETGTPVVTGTPVDAHAPIKPGAPKIARKHAVLPPARLGYFNLHGVQSSSDWYGQRDPLDPAAGPDYPIALRPADVVDGGRAPQVVFSEACYGADIIDKTAEAALALKFLACGTRAVVGSTCISYGSIAPPLIAGDLLGNAFWKFLRAGYPAGEALRRAKIHLAREMHHRQGFIDGEDQKTLISYVLFGDPLALPTENGPHPKAFTRPLHPASVKVVCDRSNSSACSGSLSSAGSGRRTDGPAAISHTSGDGLSPTTLAHVRKVVEQYLPGMANASLSYSHLHNGCGATSAPGAAETSGVASRTSGVAGTSGAFGCAACQNRHCPAAQMAALTGPTETPPAWSVITLCQQTAAAPASPAYQAAYQAKSPAQDWVHTHYARITLDEHGEVVKIAVSR